jgi:hypothetical protein
VGNEDDLKRYDRFNIALKSADLVGPPETKKVYVIDKYEVRPNYFKIPLKENR